MTLMIASNSRKDTIRPLMTRPDQSMTFEAGTVSACENEAGRAVESINFPPVKFKPSFSVGPFDLMSWQAGDLNQRPDFHRALAHARNLFRNLDGLIEILRLHQEVAAELFPHFRERAVGHQTVAVAHLDAGCCRHRLQWVGGEVLPLRLEHVRKLSRLAVTLLPLALGPGLLVGVNEQHVLHLCASMG